MGNGIHFGITGKAGLLNMKLRYIAAAYAAALLLLAGWILWQTDVPERGAVDMVWYNVQYRGIGEALESGTDRSEVEEAFDCYVLFLSDEDYRLRLNELTSSRAVILDYERDGEIVGKIGWQEARNHYELLEEELRKKAVAFCVLSLLLGAGLLFGVYLAFVRPFLELKRFSSLIARGNLDVPLPMRKRNYFGAFTESFDIMREELKRARESEYRANRSKKELVAQLSHDIKTPLAAIRAVCELLQVKEKNPDTLEKITVIQGRTDLIGQLVDNLFHATMEELQALKVEAAQEPSTVIGEMLGELQYYGEIRIKNHVPECLVYMDKLRFSQVIDNIVSNSYKYAGTPIEVFFGEENDGIRVEICDSGPGVSPEELPLITGKFYRGSNASGKSGSGLGLYLAGMFMERMGGGMECSGDGGFKVRLFLKKV